MVPSIPRDIDHQIFGLLKVDKINELMKSFVNIFANIRILDGWLRAVVDLRKL